MRFQRIKTNSSAFKFENTVSVVRVLKMSVQSRNFSLCSTNDEQYCVDDRNNNVKNDQNSNKTIKKPIELVEENSRQIDLQSCGRIDDDAKFKCKNSEKFKIENYSHDVQSNDSHSNDSIGTIKSSAAINFSVDSILSGVNPTQACNKDTAKLTDTPKPTIADDFNRIHRPMPMRYLSNSNIFQGN